MELQDTKLGHTIGRHSGMAGVIDIELTLINC
jgi:hypothetical protein